jgi:hypothetical protein
VIFPTAERVKPREIAGIFLLTAAAILVHGYHPFVEDAEIYVPGIKKLLNPAFYPFNDGFFASHARLTLFPNLIAGSVRITYLPFEWVLLTWHFACIFLLLLACWKLGQICLGTTRAAWGSAGLVAALLTLPVAGTALYIMDQYLNTRSFSTATVMWVVVATIQRKYGQAAAWLVLTVLIHPLMAGFALVFAGLLVWRQHTALLSKRQHASALMLFPIVFFPPVTSAYRQVLNSHSYFFLVRWEWYEWLGIFGPLIVLWWIARIAQRRNLSSLEALCSTSIVFGVFFFAVGLAITIPPQFARFVELQPMRCLHLIYVLLFAISGGLLAEHVLKAKSWRWIAVFLPLCAGMFYAQRQLFPATPHIESPGRNPQNQWVEAFVWIRHNTPMNAYFALDPDHMRSPGEDQHGFRAMAERSRLADRVKDSGAVTMFPALAPSWLEQVNSEQGWKSFGAEDFKRLHQKYGVNWVVLQQPGIAGMQCPYRNPAVLVCLVGQEHQKAQAQ